MPVPTGPCGQLKVGSVSPGARAGAGSVGGRVWPEGHSLPPGGSETDVVDLGLKRLPLCPKALRTPRHQAGKCGLSDFAPLWLQRSGIWLAPGRTFELFRFSSLHHAASRRRVDPVPKSLLPRRPFGLCLGRANPRLDDWKVRRATDSGNSGTAQLSTFRLNASGQHWITQRFVADRADYPRSRCARSRNRRALSLMKPAASCWS